MPVIYLIRHGQASFGKEDYDQLSEPGWEQSRLLGRALQNQMLGLPRALCGTMRRHRETAEATLGELGLPKEWHTDTGFNEYNHEELLAVDWPLAPGHRPPRAHRLAGAAATAAQGFPGPL